VLHVTYDGQAGRPFSPQSSIRRRPPRDPVRRAAGAGRRRWQRRLETVILPTDALSPCAGYRQYRG